MRLPIARLLVKAAKWLAPRVQDEIEQEVGRRMSGGQPDAPIPPRPPTDSSRPPEGP